MLWGTGRTRIRPQRSRPASRRRFLELEPCEARRLLDGGLVSFLSIDSPSITEGNSGTKLLTFTVTLDPANIEETVTVDFTITDGTALVGQDYLAQSGRLTFLPDDVQQTITVPILGDLDSEADER